MNGCRGCLADILWVIAAALLGSMVGGGGFSNICPPYGPDYHEGIGWGFAMMGYSMLGALLFAFCTAVYRLKRLR